MIMKNFKNEKIQEANRYIKELVYQSAHLENKEITYAETINTIEYYKEAIKKIPFEKVAIIDGLRKAYEYIIQRANSNEMPNEKDIQQVNRLIDGYEESIEAGNWRRHKVRISGGSWVPPIWSTEQCTHFILNKSNIKSFDDGTKLCADISKNQLFSNGNKRTAICYANLVLLYNGYDCIKINDCTEYTNKLIDYYEDENNFNKYLEYIKKESIDSNEQEMNNEMEM